MPVSAVSFRTDEQQKKSYLGSILTGTVTGIATGWAAGVLGNREKDPWEICQMKPDEFSLTGDASESENKAVATIKGVLSEVQAFVADDAIKAREKNIDDKLSAIFKDKTEMPVVDYVKSQTQFPSLEALEKHLSDSADKDTRLSKLVDLLKEAKDNISKDDLKRFEIEMEKEVFADKCKQKIEKPLETLKGKLPKSFSTKWSTIGALAGAVLGVFVYSVLRGSKKQN